MALIASGKVKNNVVILDRQQVGLSGFRAVLSEHVPDTWGRWVTAGVVAEPSWLQHRSEAHALPSAAVRHCSMAGHDLELSETQVSCLLFARQAGPS